MLFSWQPCQILNAFIGLPSCACLFQCCWLSSTGLYTLNQKLSMSGYPTPSRNSKMVRGRERLPSRSSSPPDPSFFYPTDFRNLERKRWSWWRFPLWLTAKVWEETPEAVWRRRASRGTTVSREEAAGKGRCLKSGRDQGSCFLLFHRGRLRMQRKVSSRTACSAKVNAYCTRVSGLINCAVRSNQVGQSGDSN
jgi:hypothetical protein